MLLLLLLYCFFSLWVFPTRARESGFYWKAISYILRILRGRFFFFLALYLQPTINPFLPFPKAVRKREFSFFFLRSKYPVCIRRSNQLSRVDSSPPMQYEVATGHSFSVVGVLISFFVSEKYQGWRADFFCGFFGGDGELRDPIVSQHCRAGRARGRGNFSKSLFLPFAIRAHFFPPLTPPSLLSRRSVDRKGDSPKEKKGWKKLIKFFS